jgi:hypothetical protein
MLSYAALRTSVLVFCISGDALPTCSNISSTRRTSSLAATKNGSIIPVGLMDIEFAGKYADKSVDIVSYAVVSDQEL